MNRFLKIILILLALIFVAIVSIGLYVNFKKPTHFGNKAPDVKVVYDSNMIAEGARMATLLCVNCHGNEGKLSGHYMADVKTFGELYAPNITHHPNSQLNGYTDGELLYLFRTGIKKDGYYAPPWMPKFPLMSDKDVESIIAFLRSDHPLLEPVDVVQPAPVPSFLAKALTLMVFKPLEYPTAKIEEPDTNNKVVWGEYLSTAKFDCYSCHSADFATMNIMEPEKTPGYFGGGNPLERLDGSPIFSANLTMDQETGLGHWTEDQFIKAVRFGERPSGIATAYPMVPFSNMTNSEVSAIWAYLQTIPVINNPKLKK